MSKTRYTQFHKSIESFCNAKFVPEYKFLPNRKFRFDFVNIESMLAIEINGGVWSNGRHNRGTGFVSDMEKINLAQLYGYRVLQFTPQQLNSASTFDIIKTMINK